ncbi:MAG: hypothetical protein AB1499_11585 [Nitrospirota bacterium]
MISLRALLLVPVLCALLVSFTERKQEFSADLDRDGAAERILAETIQSGDQERETDAISIRLTVWKNDARLLEQYLDGGLFAEERVDDIKDITGDRQAELITMTRPAPDCAKCEAHGIYTFDGGKFDHVLNLFSLDNGDSMINVVLTRIADIRREFIDFYNMRTSANCSLEEDMSECSMSEPWLLDTNMDGSKEMVRLIGSYGGDKKSYGLCVFELSPEGTPSRRVFYPLQLSEGSDLTLVGFMKARYNRTQMLVNYLHPGTSVFYPVLHAFEIMGTYVRETGEFPGFYSHAVPERLRDLDGNGYTEIIFVDDYIWPSGEAHANVVPVYGIAEYENGKYRTANKKFKRAYEEINGFLF